MPSATEVDSLVNFEFVTPANDEPTAMRDLVPMQPVAPLPDKSAAVDLTLGHIAPTYSVVSMYPNLNLTMRDMGSWDHLLQCSLKEDNGGFHAHDYHIIQTVSPFYMRFPTRPCAWFITGPGHLGRAFPSDETKLQSGVVLCLEDTSISTFLPVADYPIIFIRLKKPICHEEGYIIYQFTCNLFSRSPNPESLESPTNLIVIPKYHAHKEAAHLEYEISTLHQRVLERAYALPLLHTWENEWSPLPFGKIEDLLWSEEVEKAELGQIEQEGQNLAMQWEKQSWEE
ncbi:hypothetical protein PILCRDRAFT_10428 [Piloderma croceum F 1598]|uniref:Uncharacterized protein n=1 Tax=Piloderma croceum (strain F 1598) TaxID=765440 RepID=A0A0C3F3E4_PILCF|nr:hypothetical protein PILCRDRAFT_10428 [Piloderma croceum F 1598]